MDAQVALERKPEIESEGAPPAASAASGRVDRYRLGLLATGHAVTDSYGQSLLAPVFPMLAERLGLTLTQVGGLPMVMGLSASLAQPLLAVLSDRHPRWCMVAAGPLLAALFIGCVGFARDYWQLALILFLAGLGIGAYHPQGALLARRAGRGSALAMSAFTVGGNIGFGLAPVLGRLYTGWFGLERFYLAALPAVLFAVVMQRAFRTMETPQAGERRGTPARDGEPAASDDRRNRIALAALTMTVVVRSAVQIGITTFLPFLIQQRFPGAHGAAIASGALSAFLLASAFAGPPGGHLSDRFGRRTVMTVSFLLAPWPLLLALQQTGAAMVALLALGAFILMLPHPGNVVMAQELMPRNAGVAASLITGLAWGVAQILALPLGRIAEAVGVGPALSGLTLVPLLGVPLMLYVREARAAGEQPAPQ